MSTVQELLAQKAAIDAQIAEAKVEAFTDVLTSIVVLCDDHGFGLDEMASALISAHNKRLPKKRNKGMAKWSYLPTGATWTGVGRKPNWFADSGNVVAM